MYNQFSQFKISKRVTEYINKCMKPILQEEQRDKVPFYEIKYLVVTGEYYYIFNGVDFLNLYSDYLQEIRVKIKPLLT